MRYIISVDLGTTLIKCSAYGEKGTCAASDSVDCDIAYPQPGYAEQNAAAWYEGVCGAIRKIVEKLGADAVYEGIGISSQGISVVPVDAELKPLCPALSWLDSRAIVETEWLRGQIGEEEAYGISGKFLSPSYTLPKLLWLREHKPEIFGRASKFLLPMDYLAARLTGRCATDGTMAAGTLLYDIGQKDWSGKLLELAGLSPDLLPEVLPNGTPVGTLNRESAALTGLPPWVPVFNGGQDQKIAAFGVGASEENVTLSLGTAGALEMFVSDAKKQKSLPFFPYIRSDSLVLEGCVNTAGAAIKWARDNIGDRWSYDEVDRRCEPVPVGSGGVRFYPYLAQRGTPHRGEQSFGIIQGISLNTTRAHMLRALYEGIGYECRLNLECAYRAGARYKKLTIFGGGGKSAELCRILTDITALPVTVMKSTEVCSYGAARLAAEALGWDGEAFAEGLEEGITLEPRAENVTLYTGLYKEYLENL